jgi:hypothetical protein
MFFLYKSSRQLEKQMPMIADIVLPLVYFDPLKLLLCLYSSIQFVLIFVLVKTDITHMLSLWPL